LAVALILRGLGYIDSYWLLIPIVFLGVGTWFLAIGGSFGDRSAGLGLVAIGVLWLLNEFYNIGIVVGAGIFVAIMGLLAVSSKRG
jgi:hypothetical protein